MRRIDADFTDRVCRIINDIPEGKVATYGMVAALSGYPRAWRRVARVVSRENLPAPCQRVVRAGGGLAPVDAFPQQRQLLLDEGVRFMPSGRVDLKSCRWEPFSPPGR